MQTNTINKTIFPWGAFFGYFYKEINKENTHIIKTKPLYINTQKGGFYFIYDSKSQEIAFNFLENVVTKFIEFFPLGLLKVNVIDFGKNKLPHLSLLQEKNIVRFAQTPTKANILFEYLEEQIFLKRHYKIFNHQYPNITEYNFEHKEPLTYHILLLNLADFPNVQSSKKRLDSFLESAFDAGIYIIAYANKKFLLQEQFLATKSIISYLPKLEIYENRFHFSSELFEFHEIINNYIFEYLNDSLLTIINHLLQNQTSPKQSLIYQYIDDLSNFHSHNEYKDIMREEEDELYWELTLQKNTQKAYEKYIKHFPDGKFLKKAQEKITEFKIEHEKIVWQRTCANNTLLAYEDYLKIFPNGIYAKDAKEKINKILETDNRLKEIIEWADKNNITKDDIPRSLNALEEITHLNLQNYGLHELPKSLANLKNVVSINLHHNEFTTFPKVLLEMKNLKKIDLSWNNIRSIPDEIVSLKHLESLKLDLTHIYTPPKTLEKLNIKVQKDIENIIERNKRAEKRAWEEAIKSDSINSYKRFLAYYPYGENAKEAKKRIEEFTLWEKINLTALENERPKLLQEYKEKFPNGRYIKIVNKLQKKYIKKMPKFFTKFLPKKFSIKDFIFKLKNKK